MYRIKSILLILMTVTVAWSQDITDGCDLPDDPNGIVSFFHITPDGTVLYKSIYDMGGFQLAVVGATVNSASGGAAGAAGFMLSTSGSTVLGFSMTGAVIPAGCGTLVNLSLNGDAQGLDMEFPAGVSDQVGNSLYFEYYPPVVYGCTNDTACNYDSSAQAENVPSTCWWANDGCTCDDPNNSLPDMCSTCDTNPANDCIQDCAGNYCNAGDDGCLHNMGEDQSQDPNIGIDECGICGGGNSAMDDCGVCNGNNSSCVDCLGVANGDAEEDECGICDNDNSNDCIQDCAGEWGGTAEVDDCDVCNGDGSTCEDCAGNAGGSAEEDNCGICDITY